MACQLGCSEDTRVLVMDRCSQQVIGDITDSVSFLKYGRELDDDSECEISVHFESDASGQACCRIFTNLHTWRHEITILRDPDPDPIWQGVIVTIEGQRDIGHIVARDIVTWLDFRAVHAAYEFVQVDLTTIAMTVIEDAIMAHNDVCLLEYVQQSPAGVLGDLSLRANQRTAGEVLRELTQAGLNFTVVGRSLVLGGGFAFGPVGPLRDEHFLGDVKVEERGLSAATKWYMPGSDPNAGVVGVCGGVDPYYGLIEKAVETFAENTDVAFLTEAACSRLSYTNPPPTVVSIPDDASLAPSAPVCPANLVPGTLVDIDISELCRPTRTRQRLTAVQFRSDERGETVDITVAPQLPLGLALEQAGG